MIRIHSRFVEGSLWTSLKQNIQKPFLGYPVPAHKRFGDKIRMLTLHLPHPLPPSRFLSANSKSRGIFLETRTCLHIVQFGKSAALSGKLRMLLFPFVLSLLQNCQYLATLKQRRLPQTPLSVATDPSPTCKPQTQNST